jgi:hypothetical protein
MHQERLHIRDFDSGVFCNGFKNGFAIVSLSLHGMLVKIIKPLRHLLPFFVNSYGFAPIGIVVI